MGLYSNQLKLSAESIGLLALDYMDRAEDNTLIPIHSVFSRVVNLKTNSGLISIANRSIGRAASYITVNQDIDFLSYDLGAGDMASLKNRSLILNGHIILDLKSVQPWRDIIKNDFVWKRKNIPCENIAAFKSAVDRYGAEGSIWKKLFNDYDLKEKISMFRENRWGEAVGKLAGYGTGLTPSGDDLLLGLLSVVNTCEDFISVRDILKNEILLNLYHTSDISAYFLRMAAENYYHEYVQEVLYSMLYGLRENVMLSVKQLLKIGATSGTDIAAGMYIGFQFF